MRELSLGLESGGTESLEMTSGVTSEHEAVVDSDEKNWLSVCEGQTFFRKMNHMVHPHTLERMTFHGKKGQEVEEGVRNQRMSFLSVCLI